ncbi:MAG: helix-turn-helix domain-containing protein [Luteolibacter sp.]
MSGEKPPPIRDAARLEADGFLVFISLLQSISQKSVRKFLEFLCTFRRRFRGSSIGRSRQLPDFENWSVQELRVAIDCCPDRKAQKRMNAMLLLFCGGSFDLAQAQAGVSERCLQMWTSSFNRQGINGITYRPRSGRPRLMSGNEVERIILPVVDNPCEAGQRHWTAVKLCGWLREIKEIAISYPTVVRYLHEKNYARRIPRPVPEPPDREA